MAAFFYYFRPKIISENGNLVIESALDKNITFRFKGSGCLSLNDLNLLNLIGKSHLNGSTSEINSRVTQLETQLQTFKIHGRRGITTRLSRLENR